MYYLLQMLLFGFLNMLFTCVGRLEDKGWLLQTSTNNEIKLKQPDAYFTDVSLAQGTPATAPGHVG